MTLFEFSAIAIAIWCMILALIDNISAISNSLSYEIDKVIYGFLLTASILTCINLLITTKVVL